MFTFPGRVAATSVAHGSVRKTQVERGEPHGCPSRERLNTFRHSFPRPPA